MFGDRYDTVIIHALDFAQPQGKIEKNRAGKKGVTLKYDAPVPVDVIDFQFTEFRQVF